MVMGAIIIRVILHAYHDGKVDYDDYHDAGNDFVVAMMMVMIGDNNDDGGNVFCGSNDDGDDFGDSNDDDNDYGTA